MEISNYSILEAGMQCSQGVKNVRMETPIIADSSKIIIIPFMGVHDSGEFQKEITITIAIHNTNRCSAKARSFRQEIFPTLKPILSS
jgi:hypothetical protein